MSFRNFDNNWGWLVRWVTAVLVVTFGVAMLYFKSEFFTRAESLELIPIPEKVHRIEADIKPLKSAPARLDTVERDIEPLRPLPVRVQLLEQQAVQQIGINAKRDTQVETLATAINALATQQAVAISKIDDLRKQNERIEGKLDTAARNADH